jgi:PAS domain S-box-containing protein
LGEGSGLSPEAIEAQYPTTVPLGERHPVSGTQAADGSGAATRVAEELYRFTERLYRAATRNDVYEAALDIIARALGCRRASILLFDDAGIMRFAAWRDLSDGYRRALEGHSPWTRDVKDPQPVCIQDIQGANLPEFLKDTIKAEQIWALAFFPLVANNALVGKFMTYYDARHVFSDAELALSLTIARQLGFDLERRMAEEALRETQRQLQSELAALAERNIQLALAGKAALVGSYAYDTDTEIMQISEGYVAIHGFPEGTTEIARGACLAGVHPGDTARVEQCRSEAFHACRREYCVEYRIVGSGGEMRWVETRCFITYDSEGCPRRVVGVSIDITERKRVEEQQGRLVAELDHRVKNVLATVQAIAAHTMQASSSMEQFVSALDGRIRSLGSTHELLSHRRWLGIPLAELVERELAPYSTGSNTEIGGPDVMLSAEAGQTVGMMLHELVTNAAKHGALSVPSGRVSINWHLPLNGGAGDRLILTWRETSGPSVVPPGRSSYGMQVVRELIPYELGGTIDHVLAPDGARCHMEIPLARLNRGSSHDN